MDCRKFHRSLEDYLDGGLDFAGRFGMERHAEQCFACGKELADARKLRQLTASIVRVKAPVDFEARLRAEITRRKSQGFFVRLRSRLDYGFTWPALSWPRLASSTAICAALAFGISSMRYWQQETPATPHAPVMARQTAEPATPGVVASAPAIVEPTTMPTEAGAPAVPVAVAMSPAAPDSLPEPVVAGSPEPVNALQAMVTEASELSPELSGQKKRSRTEAVDLLLLGPESLPTPERLPRKIYVRYGPPSEEYFIMNVSH